jgi:adenylate kinase
MRLVLLGPPGVGKGTQADLIAKEFKIKHYSTGDIFREILNGSSKLSRKLEKYVNTGELVPDEIVIQTIKKVLWRDGINRKGWILDGFPRNLIQAEMLDDLLSEENKKLNFAVYLYADKNILIDRLSKRRVCSVCGIIYSLQTNPPKRNGICDKCGGKLIQRKDDKKETILKRILIFEDEFNPIREYYINKGILIEVNGEGKVKDVFNQTIEKLKNGQKRRN